MGAAGWDYAMIGGYYRRFNKIYAITDFGLARPENKSIADPLELKFPYKKILDSFLSKEIDKWQQCQTLDSESSDPLKATAGFAAEQNAPTL